jgi:ATP-dependent protease ClpP protease subunit
MRQAGSQQRLVASGLSLETAVPDMAEAKVSYLGFTGSIDTAGVTRVAAALNNAVNNGVDEAHLCFSSLGGYVADGVYLYNHIRGLPLKVVAHNVGSVSSIAVTVFLAADERYCSSHAMFMVHPTVIPSQEGMGAERLQSALDAALADDRRTENILRERARIPDCLLTERRTRDVHITPAQAAEYGIVHEVREFLLPPGNQIIQV